MSTGPPGDEDRGLERVTPDPDADPNADPGDADQGAPDADDADPDSTSLISIETGMSATVRLGPGEEPQVMTLELVGSPDQILAALRHFLDAWPVEMKPESEG